MEYRRLGSTGLEVSGIGLGGNNFGRFADEKTTAAVVSHALDVGINFIDTADLYDAGRSEESWERRWTACGLRVLIATKFASPMGGGPNSGGGSRYYVLKAAEASLRRLKTDYIDLYQMHTPDPATPIEETLRAFDDLVGAGKVRYIGCSNFAGLADLRIADGSRGLKVWFRLRRCRASTT